MTVILDLVNKSFSNVAVMYFIGFVDPENISLDTKKYISSWSRNKDIIKIRFDVWTRRHFSMFGHFFFKWPKDYVAVKLD